MTAPSSSTRASASRDDAGFTLIELLVTLIITSLLIGVIYGVINGLFDQTQSQQRAVTALQQEQSTSQLILDSFHGIVLIANGSTATHLVAEIETGVLSTGFIQYSQLDVQLNAPSAGQVGFLTVSVTPSTGGPVTVQESDVDYSVAENGLFTYLYNTNTGSSSGTTLKALTPDIPSTIQALGEISGISVNIPFLVGNPTGTGYDQVVTLNTTSFLAGPGGTSNLSQGVPTTTQLSLSDSNGTVTAVSTTTPAPLDGESSGAPTGGTVIFTAQKTVNGTASGSPITNSAPVVSGSGQATYKFSNLAVGSTYSITAQFEGTVTNSTLGVTAPSTWNQNFGEYAASSASSSQSTSIKVS